MPVRNSANQLKVETLDSDQGFCSVKGSVISLHYLAKVCTGWSKKNVPTCFCQNFVKSLSQLLILTCRWPRQ